MADWPIPSPSSLAIVVSLRGCKDHRLVRVLGEWPGSVCEWLLCVFISLTHLLKAQFVVTAAGREIVHVVVLVRGVIVMEMLVWFGL